MPSIKSAKRDLESLEPQAQEIIFHYLEEVFVLGAFATEVTNEVKKSRFSRGKVCPHCGHAEVSRNGKFNGAQRYICKSCRKTFTDFTRSPKHNSNKDVTKWIKYAKCMINGYSIIKCAREVGISIPTSFYWRHKILDAIRAYMDLCNGRMKHTDLERLFKDRIEDNPIFCTDSHKSYIKFAQNLGIELQQIRREKRKEGIYHIQHINSFIAN